MNQEVLEEILDEIKKGCPENELIKMHQWKCTCINRGSVKINDGFLRATVGNDLTIRYIDIESISEIEVKKKKE